MTVKPRRQRLRLSQRPPSLLELPVVVVVVLFGWLGLARNNHYGHGHSLTCWAWSAASSHTARSTTIAATKACLFYSARRATTTTTTTTTTTALASSAARTRRSADDLAAADDDDVAYPSRETAVVAWGTPAIIRQNNNKNMISNNSEPKNGHVRQPDDASGWSSAFSEDLLDPETVQQIVSTVFPSSTGGLRGKEEESLSSHGNPDPAVYLFDGSCNFCDATVHWCHDRDPTLRFAPLQSRTGRALVQHFVSDSNAHTRRQHVQ